MKTLSKAEEKRQKDQFNCVLNNLQFKTVDFLNEYLGRFAEYRLNENKWRLAKLLEKAENLRTPNDRFFIKNAEERLLRGSIIAFEAYKEAQEVYNRNLSNLAKRMIDFGVETAGLHVERIASKAGQLELIVTCKNGTQIHARTIIASGPVQSPHYRFITTKRK